MFEGLIKEKIESNPESISGEELGALVEALAPIVTNQPLHVVMLAVSHLMHDLHFVPMVREAMANGPQGLKEIPAGIGGTFPLNSMASAKFEIGLDKDLIKEELLRRKECSGDCGGDCAKH